MKSVKIPFMSNLIIAIMSGLATLVMSYAGQLVENIIPSTICNIAGGGIVSLVGIYMIVSYFVKKKHPVEPDNPNKKSEDVGNQINIESLKYIIKKPDQADLDSSRCISIGESLLLGIALSINALATGFGAGMTGISVIGTTISVMVFSLLTIFIGTHVGERYISRLIGNHGEFIAGLILFVIGIYEMVF